eukprot:2983148-Amphidinium_carterae.1
MINDLPEGAETPLHADVRNTGLNIVDPLCAVSHASGGEFVLEGHAQECADVTCATEWGNTTDQARATVS